MIGNYRARFVVLKVIDHWWVVILTNKPSPAHRTELVKGSAFTVG